MPHLLLKIVKWALIAFGGFTLASVIIGVILIAIQGVPVAAHTNSPPATIAPIPAPSPTSITLSFDCSIGQVDQYTLVITNNNDYLVDINSISVVFYNQSGIEMGSDTPDNMIIPANTNYDYRGSYYQSALGGNPASCSEVNWSAN
jgi:hypothetical protein